ncbi:MAG: YciE/YciF ferroxidase family protein [Gemmatimonadaceae bacterium]
MQIATLHDLMVHELKDLYSAERQLVQALPRMAKRASSAELQQAIRSHLSQTEQHVARLEQVFEVLGASGRGVKCKGMEGLIEEGKELLEQDIADDVLDAGIIAAAQRMEHYEIAAYGTLCEYARSMQHEDVLGLLQATLEEEKETDRLLTSIAEGGINALAEHHDRADMDAGDAGDRGKGSSSARGSGNGRTKVGARRR